MDLDLNQKPKDIMEVYVGEDGDYDRPWTERRMAGPDMKTVEHGEPSCEEDVAEYRGPVREENAVHCGGIDGNQRSKANANVESLGRRAREMD
jgi:hypothetical protein